MHTYAHTINKQTNIYTYTHTHTHTHTNEKSVGLQCRDIIYI